MGNCGYLITSLYILVTSFVKSGGSVTKNKVPTDVIGGLIIPGGDEVFHRTAGGEAVGHS